MPRLYLRRYFNPDFIFGYADGTKLYDALYGMEVVASNVPIHG